MTPADVSPPRAVVITGASSGPAAGSDRFRIGQVPSVDEVVGAAYLARVAPRRLTLRVGARLTGDRSVAVCPESAGGNRVDWPHVTQVRRRLSTGGEPEDATRRDPHAR